MTNADATLRRLVEIGALAPLDRHFAATLAALGGGETALLAAVASAARRRGHVCLPLASCAGRRLLDALGWHRQDDEDAAPGADQGEELAEVRLPPLGELVAAATASPVVAVRGAGGEEEPSAVEPAPLVLDNGRLYLRRVFETERTLADRLAARARPAEAPDEGAEALLRRLFPADDAARQAAGLAASGRLCIVTGGPGTGKTTLAGRLLALLAAAGLAAPHRIALATPTGKAAARLQQAVAAQLENAGEAAAALAAAPPRATTIHRLLRESDGGRLALDVLLVDECSMLDLSLMDRLLGLLPEQTRVILLGDAAQLASVQPGAVFSDICAEAAGAMAPCVVRLQNSHRFRADSGIGRLAAAVAAGDPGAALAALAAEDDTALAPLAGPAGFARLAADVAARDVAPLVERWRQAPPLSATDAAPALPFAPRRVLLAHRAGAFGVERFNRLVARALGQAGLAPPEDAFYLGRPIIVTRNDPATGLANGDTGIVVAAEEGRRVWFPDLAAPAGAPLLVAPGRLPPHESFFALTVHRAQGSEYDEVAFVPGPSDSPIHSRELFYTAVTRARRKVVVYADAATVRASVARATERSSGLAARLANGA